MFISNRVINVKPIFILSAENFINQKYEYIEYYNKFVNFYKFS